MVPLVEHRTGGLLLTRLEPERRFLERCLQELDFVV